MWNIHKEWERSQNVGKRDLCQLKNKLHKESLVSDLVCLLMGLLDHERPFTDISRLFCKTFFKTSHNKLVKIKWRI